MLIIKAKNNIPREEMKHIYRNLLEQMQLGLIFIDDEYEISIVEPSMKWLSVNDALPENAKDVLVTDGGDVFIGWYDNANGRYEWRSNDSRFYPASHPIKAWMPLPELYKESEDKI